MTSVFPNLDAAVEYTFKNRGGTFRTTDLTPVNPVEGYAVSVKSHGTGNGALLSRRYLASRLFDALVGNITPYIGTWIDQNSSGNDVCYIDHVVILPDRASAEIIGRTFRQKSIYDFANDEVIYL